MVRKLLDQVKGAVRHKHIKALFMAGQDFRAARQSRQLFLSSAGSSTSVPVLLGGLEPLLGVKTNVLEQGADQVGCHGSGDVLN